MALRAVKDNSSDRVLVIDVDRSQGGEDYNGVGTWCDFTFEQVPTRNVDPELHPWHYEVSGNSLVCVDGE